MRSAPPNRHLSRNRPARHHLRALEPTYGPKDGSTSGPWLGVTAVARALGIDRKTARGWIQRGLIQGVKLPNGYHRVHAGVVAYLAEPLRRHARAVQLALDLGADR